MRDLVGDVDARRECLNKDVNPLAVKARLCGARLGEGDAQVIEIRLRSLVLRPERERQRVRCGDRELWPNLGDAR